MSLLTFGTAVCIVWKSHLTTNEQMIQKRMEFFQCGKYGTLVDFVMMSNPDITRYTVSVGCGNYGEILFNLDESNIKKTITNCEDDK
jgi:hypothetical protein